VVAPAGAVAVPAVSEAVGAVVDDPATMGAEGVGVELEAAAEDGSTSPALDLDSTGFDGTGFDATAFDVADFDFGRAAAAVVRRVGVVALAVELLPDAPELRLPLDAVEVRAGVGDASADRSTQPVRDTRTQPDAAAPLATDTVVPASRDARVFAALAPRTRSVAALLPTRRVELPRCADIRARSTNPLTDTRTYWPRVSSTRSSVPERTLPMARPFGADRIAAGVFTTRACPWAAAP
jgi:hypothetical protein